MLKYLFTAQFNDGQIIKQDQEDVSKFNPLKSKFFDVLNDTRKLEKFWLLEKKRFHVIESEPQKKYLVDLTDGHFEINGVPFFLHEQTVDETKTLSNFRLIYFRRVQQSLNIDSGKAATKVMFVIGWQANLPDGKNVQKIMYIK